MSSEAIVKMLGLALELPDVGVFVNCCACEPDPISADAPSSAGC